MTLAGRVVALVQFIQAKIVGVEMVPKYKRIFVVLKDPRSN